MTLQLRNSTFIPISPPKMQAYIHCHGLIFRTIFSGIKIVSTLV
ncbi:MAG: hypothetical protein WCS69_11465 [Ignavibacteriaceae bacterium]